MTTTSFVREQSVYPFTHAVVNVAFYMVVRDLRWAIIGFYVWESVELVLSAAFSGLAEECNDSLLGDPLIGLLAILAFWLYDRATGADREFRQQALEVARALAFLIIGAASFVAPLLASDGVYWGIVLFAGIYVLTIVVCFWHLRGHAGNSVVLWVLAALVYAAASLPVLDGAPLIASSWMRVFLLASIFVVAAFVGLVSRDNRPK